MTTAEKRRRQKIAKKAVRKKARKKPGGGQLERRQQLILQQTLDLAVQHHKAGDLRKAERIYNQILQADPNQPVALHLLGAIAHQVGKDDIAVELITKAVAIKPDYAEAHYNLCYVLEKTNRTEAFREAVGRARRNCPGHPRLSRGEALLLKWDGDFVAARALLEATGEEVADARFLKERAHLLGELCDRLGDTEAAFKYFREGNRRNRDDSEAKHASGAGYLERIEVLSKRFTSDWTTGWRNLQSSDGRSDPVFLVGFPRSGTTLLDTILLSHRAISVVEERNTVRNVRKVLERLPGGYPDGLAELDPDRLAELRRIYFTELDKHLEPEDRPAVVVDKLPLNIVEAGLIHRIFPRARFLFAQRHPCDCVLSCFMQDFKINEAMANFQDLEEAARLYDKVMTLWQQYRAVLPLEVHTVRYESLIEAFEETLTKVFDFLGVDWDDGVRNYVETAYRRGKINTPSYNQVTQPLYTRARGRWERYREHMQPVLPILLPWARRFEYGD